MKFRTAAAVLSVHDFEGNPSLPADKGFAEAHA